MTGTRTLARTEVLCRDSNSASLGQRFVCILVFQNECAPAHPQRIARQSTCFRTFLGHATGAEHASSVPKMISTTATGTVLFMAARQMPTRNGNSSCHPPKFLSGVRRRRAAVDHVTRRLIDHHQSHKSGEVRRNVFFPLPQPRRALKQAQLGSACVPLCQNRFHFHGQNCQPFDSVSTRSQHRFVPNPNWLRQFAFAEKSVLLEFTNGQF